MMSSATPPARPTRILVVDDDPIILRVVEATLVRAGYEVRTVTSAEEARSLLDAVDVVVSDENLPGMGGRALLGSARASGCETPFILMTGHPSVASVVESFALGATSFLVKPLRTADLLRSVEVAARHAREAGIQRADDAPHRTAERRLHEAVDRALGSLHLVYQPICRLSSRTVFGYEVLLRSGEPSLPHPGAVLEAAEAVGRLHEVGRRVRRLTADAIPTAPADVLFFVNLHPLDLADPTLYDDDEALVPFAPRVVLEITERTDFRLVDDIPEKLDLLRARGFRMGMDDLGTGYSGLASLVDLDPEVVKIDMGLVRDIDVDARKRRLVGSLLRLCRELDRIVTAEGVERPEELATLRELGCDLVQGYLLARPGRPFPEVRW